jgi:hypothetical protein
MVASSGGKLSVAKESTVILSVESISCAGRVAKEIIKRSRMMIRFVGIITSFYFTTYEDTKKERLLSRSFFIKM